MKNKIGKICGFILGMAGFLFLFKIIFLVRIAPSDELAPGIVMFAAMCSGLLFAVVGSAVQNYFVKKNYK